jgi:hypothetical protein
MLDERSDYNQAIELLRRAAAQTDDRSFHIWLGQALTNFAASGSAHNPVELLQEAIQQQTQAGSNYDVAWDYCYLALAFQKNKAATPMREALLKCRSLLGDLPPADQAELRELVKGIK